MFALGYHFQTGIWQLSCFGHLLFFRYNLHTIMFAHRACVSPWVSVNAQ